MKRTILLATVLLLSVGGMAVAQTRTINVGDASIAYDVTGRGRTVVFIHGWTHNRSVWDDQVPVFSKRYRVVRYDSRGFGKSTGFADESVEPLDLLVLLEALRIDRAYIVGHSRGGGVALRFAAAYPERVAGLVLYGSSPTSDFPYPPGSGELFFSLPGIAKQHGLDSVWKLLLTTDLAWVPPGRADVTERYRRLWTSYSGKDLLDPRPESGKVPLPKTARLSTLRMPTLVIIGDHEIPFIAAAADTFAHRIPNVKKVVIPNAGHGAHFVEPTSFNGALLDFFNDVERATKPVGRNKKR
ncbi:MAG TPA: alpha/beta hydrolase [Gemmatimonadaceae bacterium]|nr:alpha/beta hydrolase [Gemmatimonadaceae bacterium]